MRWVWAGRYGQDADRAEQIAEMLDGRQPGQLVNSNLPVRSLLGFLCLVLLGARVGSLSGQTVMREVRDDHVSDVPAGLRLRLASF